LNIAMLLDLPASIVPDQTILRDGEREVSYADLRDGAGRAQALLVELGVGRGDRVGIFGVNSVAAVELLFGALALGAVAVPMNYRAKEPEIRHLSADSGCRVVFADERYASLLEEAKADTVERLILLGEEYEGLRAGVEPAFEIDFAVEDSDLAVLIYTSGTTSLPKGVQLTHGGLSGFALERADVADGSDRGATMVSVPLYHVAGLGTLLISVYAGRTVILMPQFDAAEWLRRVAAERPTHAFLVPTMLSKLLNAEGFEAADLGSLEAISYGAAPMPLATIQRAVEALPESVDFSGAYGMSETTSTVTVLGPEDHRRAAGESEEDHLRRLSSVGKALDGVEIVARDEAGAALGAGQAGEVFVRTGRAMTGYWGADDGPVKVVIDDDGWLSTGDVGFLDEAGYLFLVGRVGDMIIRGGENISPAEVEQTLHAHPEVGDAGVVGIPDEEWGERVGAAVVLKRDSAATLAEIEEHCRELASFKRPEVLVAVDELPRTSTGKLIRRELIDVVRGSVQRG
jgi:acyl-CoA synthetase (AMP-forming)/AMP-acid ligase II